MAEERGVEYAIIILGIIREEGEEIFQKKCSQPGGHILASKIFDEFFPEKEETPGVCNFLNPFSEKESYF